MDEAALLDEYAALLEELSAAPYQRELHLKHLDVCKKLGLPQELDEAREMMSSYWPLNQTLWEEWIADRKSVIPKGPTGDLTPHMELIELYKRSVADYLSIPLLVSYSQYFISNYYTSQGLSAPVVADGEDEPMENADRKVGEPDLILGAAFGLEEVRKVRSEVLGIGGTHLTESQKLWTIWRDFEMDLLKLDPSPEQLAQVDLLYLVRLKVPHAEIETTFAEYSSFITKHDNANYETKLPAANKIYSRPHTTMNLREPQEAKLKKSDFVDWGYLNYARWELEVPKPDLNLVQAIFNRAVKDHPMNVEIWDEYLEFGHAHLKGKAPVLLAIAERAIKNVPESGLLWAAYFRAAERVAKDSDFVEGLFQRAMATGLIEKKVDELVTLYEARAGFHRREVDAVLPNEAEAEPDLIDLVVDILEEGIEKVDQATKKGSRDPQMRLEKHLLRMLERFGRIEEASELWEKLTDSFPTSYSVWYGRADFETRVGHLKKAHEIYVQGCSQRGLDYPEYLLETWLGFERQNGTLANIEFTYTKVKRQKRGLAEKRRREAKAAAAAYVSAPEQASTTETHSASTSGVASTEAESSKKRERSPVVEQSMAKKVKFEAPVEEFTRDRENSTIFVITDASALLSQENLKALFKDCGEIRECKIKTIGDQTFAMIEFMEKTSVLPAQTKDKKRINGAELNVHIAWQSCLYVTNFPESFDKAGVEALFSKYGVLFDTRWPSKRFKNTRRFCYVQFTATEHTQAALALHGTELEPGLKLVVYVSDPGRKKDRTDAGANNKELHVAGLSKFVAEYDLRKLFSPFGAIKGIRVGMDDKGECKGFAFVEFEDEASAQASLALNNHELKKRRMSVTIAQARAVGTNNRVSEAPRVDRNELMERSLRINGIAPGTEEAIVQQTLAKHASVKLVTMNVGGTEAIVEFENAAEAAKVLASNGTLSIEGVVVEIVPATPVAPSIAQVVAETKKVAAEGTGMLMPRQATRTRGKLGIGAGRGRGRGTVPAAAAAAAASGAGSAQASTQATPATGGKSQDDFRALFAKKE